MDWTLESESVQAGDLRVYNPIGEIGLWRAFLLFDDAYPPVPGVYQIRAEAKLAGETVAPPERTAVAYYMLPYAGPEIAYNPGVLLGAPRPWILEEARQIVDGIDSGGMGDGGVGRQWADHVAELAPTATIWTPFGDVTLSDFTFGPRAFWYTSRYLFDYIYIAKFNDPLERPTARYNFNDSERQDDHKRKDGLAFNDPAYATFRGRTVARIKVTNMLWAVWGRTQAQAYPSIVLPIGADVANRLDKNKKWFEGDSASARAAYDLGIDLYEAIAHGWTDVDIMKDLFTPEAARLLQTPDVINDRNLWPRPEIKLQPNTAEWWHNTNLSDGIGFQRPSIFIGSSDEVVRRDPRDRRN